MISVTMLSLIDQINLLKDEIKSLKETTSKDDILLNDITIVKEDLMDIRGNLRDIKMKIYEGEIRRLSVENGINISGVNLSKLEKKFQGHTAVSEPSPLKLNLDENNIENEDYVDCLSSDLQIRKDTSYSQVLKLNPPIISNDKCVTFRKNLSGIDKISEKVYQNNKKFEALEIRNKSRRNLQSFNIVGKKKYTKSNLSSAPRFFDIYIGNCNLQTSEDDIKCNIKEECQIDVSGCELLDSFGRKSKSFKVSATYDERDVLLNANLWPAGIICRKFYNKRV